MMKRTLVLLSMIVFNVESLEGEVSVKGITALDPPGFEVTWIPEEKLAGEPVEGYKLLVWEIPDKEIEQWVRINGTMIKRVISKPGKVGEDHKKDPIVINIPGAKSNQTVFAPVKLHVQYELRVQAYNIKGVDGPMSSSMGIKMGD